MCVTQFSGQVATVTGAARGLGKATTLKLACEGAAVVVNDVLKELALEEAVKCA